MKQEDHVNATRIKFKVILKNTINNDGMLSVPLQKGKLMWALVGLFIRKTIYTSKLLSGR